MVNRRDCQGRGIERMDLDLGLERVGVQHQELQGGNTHLEEVGRRTLLRTIQGLGRDKEQEFDARSSCPQGDGEGMPPHGEGRRPSEWARKTTVPEDREGTWVTEVVDREPKLEVLIRRNVGERAILVHLQTWVGKGMGPVAQHQKVRQR
jgi:hypothetical protein